MATNTTSLIIVVAMAALVLAGLITLVVYKTRTQDRQGIGETIREQVREDALRHQRLEVLAVESDVTAHGVRLTLEPPAPIRFNPVTVSRPGSS